MLDYEKDLEEEKEKSELIKQDVARAKLKKKEDLGQKFQLGGSAIGAIVGGYFGGPAGAVQGASIGGSVGKGAADVISGDTSSLKGGEGQEGFSKLSEHLSKKKKKGPQWEETLEQDNPPIAGSFEEIDFGE